MGVVVAEDSVFWAKHIHGGIPLWGALLRLETGTIITLGVDGAVGKWVGMGTRKTDASNLGAMALEAAGDHGHPLFQTGRGAVISISKAPEQVPDAVGASR